MRRSRSAMRFSAGLLRGRVAKGALFRAAPTRGGHSTLSPSVALQGDGVDSYRRQIGPVIRKPRRALFLRFRLADPICEALFRPGDHVCKCLGVHAGIAPRIDGKRGIQRPPEVLVMVVKEEVWGFKRLQSLKRHPGVFNDGRMARIVDERNAIIRDFAAAERDGVGLSTFLHSRHPHSSALRVSGRPKGA